MHPNTRVGSSRGEQMGLGNFQLFRFFTYRHLEHEKLEKSKAIEKLKASLKLVEVVFHLGAPGPH